MLNYIQEYYREDYRAVFWIEAGSKETIERNYILIYGRFIGAGQETVKMEDAIPTGKGDGSWCWIVRTRSTMIKIKLILNLAYFLPFGIGVGASGQVRRGGGDTPTNVGVKGISARQGAF